jgi:beta-glucosidase
VEDGAWICMAGVDLTGAAEVLVDGEGAPVTVRLDDPYAGADLATVAVGEAGPAAGADGVHDLYVTMDSGTRITALTFHRRDAVRP